MILSTTAALVVFTSPAAEASTVRVDQVRVEDPRTYVENTAGDIASGATPLRGRIAELIIATSVEDWDGEGAAPILHQHWTEAGTFADVVAAQYALPSPFVSACGDGSVHLNWSHPTGARITIEVGPDGYACTRRAPNGKISVQDGLDRGQALAVLAEAFPR